MYKVILQRLVTPHRYDFLLVDNVWTGGDPAEYFQIGDEEINVATNELLGEEDLSCLPS